jgi:hypothetical protein
MESSLVIEVQDIASNLTKNVVKYESNKDMVEKCDELLGGLWRIVTDAFCNPEQEMNSHMVFGADRDYFIGKIFRFYEDLYKSVVWLTNFLAEGRSHGSEGKKRRRGFQQILNYLEELCKPGSSFNLFAKMAEA